MIGKTFTYGYLLACLLFVTIATSSMWFYPVTMEEEGMVVPFGRILFNSALLAMASCVVLFYRQSFAFLMDNFLLSALVLVHFSSILVSIELTQSLQFSIRLFLLVTFYGVTALIVPPEKMMRYIVGLFLVSAVLNFAYILAMPQYGIMSGIHSGAWRGLFSHKNQFGYFCVYGLVLCYNLLPRSFLLYGAGMALYGGMLLKSHSGGALASAIAGVVLSTALVYSPKLHPQVKVFALSVALLFAIGLIPFYDAIYIEILDALGKDPSLTNRTEVWDLYLAEFWRSPWLGFGADAYLFNEEFMTRIKSGMTSATSITPHNGYLVTLIQVGFVGLAVYLLVCARILWAGVAGMLESRDVWHKLFVVFTALHLIRGIGETGGSIKLSVYFALIVVGYVYLTVRIRESHA